MKSALRQDVEADLISSEAERRRFHPSLLGFHRATHDFIPFRICSRIRTGEMLKCLQSCGIIEKEKGGDYKWHQSS